MVFLGHTLFSDTSVWDISGCKVNCPVHPRWLTSWKHPSLPVENGVPQGWWFGTTFETYPSAIYGHWSPKMVSCVVSPHHWCLKSNGPPFFRKDMGCSVVGSAGTAAGLEAVVKAGAQAVNHRRWDRDSGVRLVAGESVGTLAPKIIGWWCIFEGFLRFLMVFDYAVYSHKAEKHTVLTWDFTLCPARWEGLPRGLQSSCTRRVWCHPRPVAASPTGSGEVSEQWSGRGSGYCRVFLVTEPFQTSM